MTPRPNAVGRRTPVRPPTDDLRDPARGEAVPRCRICGYPESAGHRLYPGLWSYIRLNLELTLCGKCIEENLPNRRALDPLTLDDVA